MLSGEGNENGEKKTTKGLSTKTILHVQHTFFCPFRRRCFAGLQRETSRNVLFRACLHGGGGPQIGEVTCGGSPHLSCERDQIKMRD